MLSAKYDSEYNIISYDTYIAGHNNPHHGKQLSRPHHKKRWGNRRDDEMCAWISPQQWVGSLTG